jgi:hypothetical protein
VGRNRFGKGNSLQSKYYCFGGKEDAIQNDAVARQADKFVVMYFIVNSVMYMRVAAIVYILL